MTVHSRRKPEFFNPIAVVMHAEALSRKEGHVGALDPDRVNHFPPEDDRPTIDRPPKGELWDDQDDKGIGKDGTRRNQPRSRARRAGRTEPRGVKRFGCADDTTNVGRAVIAIA
jgi:hypothetical protein